MTADRAINLGGTPSWNRQAALLGRWAAGAMVGLLAMTALLMLWRRSASALHMPLNAATLSVVGLTIVCVAGGARRLWRIDSPIDWIIVTLPSIALPAFGASLSLPGTSHAGLAVFWGLIVAEELWAWRTLLGPNSNRNRPPEEPVAGTEPEPTAESTLAPEPSESSTAPTISEAPLSDLPEDDVLQQLTRSRTAEGAEQLTGWLRLPLEAGQRTANVHVAFCPPFAKTPQVEIEQCDGPTARIKTAQVLPHGARFDLKLSQASETAVAVVLEFAASDGDIA